MNRREFLFGAVAASVVPMATAAEAVGRRVFKDDWDYLRRKWREPCANPATGLEREAFQKAVEALVAERKDVEPWSFVKARVFALGCDRAAIGVSAHDWYPAFASWHYHRNHPQGGMLWRRSKEVDDRFSPGLRDSIDRATRSGQFTVWKDFCHCSPDWDRILALGFKGMKAELLRNWKDTDYYKSKLIAIDAVFRFFDRIIAETGAEMKVAPGPRLPKELASLKRLRDGKPETAYDVLQFIYLFWVLNENFDKYQTRTLGNIDRLLTPYYRADLAAGRTTEAEFRDQLRHFWWQWGSINNYWGQPVYVGGTKADGTSEYNEVSKIVLEVHDELNLPTPKMHLKIAKNTPEWVWRKTLDMMRRQRSLSFCGEEPIARVMKSCGYTDEEARTCIIWGCYEWGVRESANGTGAGHYNLLKNVELILADAKEGRFSAETFEDFKREFYRRLGASAREQIRLIQKSNAHLADVNPSNLFALSLAYSVEKGIEPLAGGTARGNGTGVQLIGIGTTVDALVAVKEIVYDRKEMSLAGLGQAMADDWKGHEELRLRMLRSKCKWGNNDPTANALCAELVKFCAAEYNGKPNSYGGGRFGASGHTSRMHIELGKSTGATPDGRKAGEEMSKNISPTMGADTEGATALINAVATLDARDLPGDFPLDVALLPRTVADEKGLQLMRTLIETYFANGGMVVQFNIQDAETLRDAQRHPEKYENLQVRVCGWNVRWNDIPKVEQDKFILRQEMISR